MDKLTTTLFIQRIIFFIFTFTYYYAGAAGNNDPKNTVMRPPKIEKGPESKMYRNGDSMTLFCEASGSPEPTKSGYSWKKNNRTLDFNSPYIKWVDNRYGSFNIPELARGDPGVYQCFVSNKYGTAMSEKAEILIAILGNGNTDIKSYIGEQHTYMKLDYKNITSVPKPSFQWGHAESDVSLVLNPITESERIFKDQEGNLHFANLLPSDQLPTHHLYKCLVRNSYVDSTKGTSYSQITVRPANSPRVEIQHRYKSPTTTTLRGDNEAALKCFFSGYPTPPKLTWRKVGGTLPRNSDPTKSPNTLTFTNIQDDHQGDYECYPLGMDHLAQRISLIVDVAPTWRQKPQDVNITEGGNHTFVCTGEGKPQVQTTWYINSKPVTQNTVRPGIEISGENFTVYQVKRSHADGNFDLMNVQCSIGNKYGIRIGGAYLNVILPTKIKDSGRPRDFELVYEEPILFHCEAESDPSTPVKITWLWNKRPINLKDHVTQLPNNTLKIVTRDLQHSGAEFKGDYACLADNGYTQDSATATLIIKGAIPAISTPAADKRKASILDLWWIFVIIAVILLLVLFIMCVCLHLQRNRGDSYPVDKKERKDGNDPEQELIDTGYHNYQRPDDDLNKSQASLNNTLSNTTRKGSKATLSSNVRLESEDDASLADYMDPGRFNEDGSFIGLYAEGASQGSMPRHQQRQASYPYLADSQTALLDSNQ